MTGPESGHPVSREVVFDGTIMTVTVDTLRLRDGPEARFEVVEHPDAVTIVPVDESGNVVMVRQYRHAPRRVLLELPAGKMERGEEPAAAAQRELREETGLAAGELRPLGGFYAAPGFLTEYLHLFLARDLRPSPLEPDPFEIVEVVRVPAAEASAMVARGEIRDAKTIAGLCMVLGSPGVLDLPG